MILILAINANQVDKKKPLVGSQRFSEILGSLRQKKTSAQGGG